jgi:hypothetical protein
MDAVLLSLLLPPLLLLLQFLLLLMLLLLMLGGWNRGQILLPWLKFKLGGFAWKPEAVP